MRIQSEQGIAAMGVVIMLLVVLSLLGTALWQYSMFEINAARRNEEYLQALYLAQAGAEAAKEFWLNAGVSNKPEGSLERVYYNLDTGEFQLEEPERYLGFFDVTIKINMDESSYKHNLTEIISTATVGNISRTVTLVTYPHRFGHELNPIWYEENEGYINTRMPYYTPYEDMIVVKPQTSLRFQSAYLPGSATFSASSILFEVQIDLDPGQTVFDLDYDGNIRDGFLYIESESIFFDEIIMMYAPKGELFGRTFPEVKRGVILKVPEGKGIPGSQIPGADQSAQYGRVHFGNRVVKQNYNWNWLLIFYGLLKNGQETVKVNSQPVEGKSFYFRDGTDLLNLRPDSADLIEIKDDFAWSQFYNKRFFWE